MSGPKLSEAELARLREEQLERERQEALRRLQEAQRAYREACDKLQALKAHANNWFMQIDQTYRDMIKRKYDQILGIVAEEPVTDIKDPQSYHEATDQMNSNISVAAKELDLIFKNVSDKVNSGQKLTDTGCSYQTFQTIVNDKKKAVDVLKLDFACDYDQHILKKQLQGLLQHLLALGNRTDIPGLDEFGREKSINVNKLLQDSDMWNKRAQIRAYMQQILNEEQEIIRVWNEKKRLYDSYLALAVVLDITPKNPRDFTSVTELEQEIASLEQQYKKKDEMDYIADQINSVMVDLGYTFVASRVLTKQDKGETDFSLYKVDDQTGIAVYTDQSGGVMMRMTVLGDDPTITDADRDFSYQRQIDFCAGHPDLVDALAERGVYLKQKSYQEPDRKHTYKICIAKKDGIKKNNLNHSKVKNQKLDRRRRRRAGSKKMRAM